MFEAELTMKFRITVERDEDGFYVGEALGLEGCYSQGLTIDELLTNIREAILLCLEEQGSKALPEFVGVQRVTVK